MATRAQILRNRHSSLKTTTSTTSTFTADDKNNNNSLRANQSATTTTVLEVLKGLLLIATLPLAYVVGIWLGSNFTLGEFAIAMVPKPIFPDVCSTPMQMAQRKIPPISTANSTQILQVFALIRHGNRATASPDLVCWANSTIGSRFGCVNKDMHQLPSIQDKSEKTRRKKKQNKMLSFAIVAPNNNKGKACRPGLLFDFSYDELTANGRHVRDAYITTDVEGMQLFESVIYEERPYNSTTFLLPDSPTSMDFMTISLQMFLYGLFEISRRTVVDISVPSLGMEENRNERERLVKAATESKKSQSVQRLNAIREGYKKENPSLAAILQPFESFDARQMRDCLLTTICTGGKLPVGLDDYTHDSDNSLFTKMIGHSTWDYMYKYLFNDTAYSKIKIRLLVELIKEAFATTATKLSDLSVISKPRLLVFPIGNHYMQSLAAVLCGSSLDNSMGAPSASQILIEHHIILDSQRHVFRLLWNGKVVTDRVTGCGLSSELCDLSVLFGHFKRTQISPY